MVPRAKKPKKKAIHRPAKTPFEYVKATNYLNIAAMVRTLATVYDWNKEQIDAFMESHMALLQEISDHRTNIKHFVKDTEDLTGVNVRELIDKTCEVIERTETMKIKDFILLNPCPKCGGDAEAVTTWYANGGDGYTKKVVRCTVCGKNVARTTGQEAVKAWNRLR